MATMLRDRTGALSLSTSAMRSFMDSIGSRLDEARDTGRYLVGLLVFLGLLGTFWGLLETIQSVGHAIDTLDSKATDNVQLFSDLKAGLSAPLKGMGTAFSSSLLGLCRFARSRLSRTASQPRAQPLLQRARRMAVGHHRADAGRRASASSDYVNRQLLGAVVDMQRALEDFSNRLAEQPVVPPKILTQPPQQATR